MRLVRCEATSETTVANILIIDAEERRRLRLARLLEGAEHQVRFAPSAAVARKAVEEWPVDLVVSALALPDTNGLRLFRELTTAQGWIRCVVFSNADDPVLIRAMEEGVLAALALPLAEAQLMSAVTAALAKPRPWARHVA